MASSDLVMLSQTDGDFFEVQTPPQCFEGTQ